MADIVGALAKMQVEELDQGSANSEAVQTKIGANINELIDLVGENVLKRQRFTSSGTFTMPSSSNISFVVLVGRGGAGGGGGSESATNDGSGGLRGGDTTFGSLARFYAGTGGFPGTSAGEGLGGEGHGGGKPGGWAGSGGLYLGGEGDSKGGNGGVPGFFRNAGGGGGGTENTVKVVAVTPGSSYSVTIGAGGSGGAGGFGGGGVAGQDGEDGELTVIYF